MGIGLLQQHRRPKQNPDNASGVAQLDTKTRRNRQGRNLVQFDTSKQVRASFLKPTYYFRICSANIFSEKNEPGFNFFAQFTYSIADWMVEMISSRLLTASARSSQALSDFA